MTTNAAVGQRITCTYVVVDQHGNPMLKQPALDTMALWTDSPSALGVDSNQVSADGTTDVVTVKAGGTDTVGVRIVIGGITFKASELIQIPAFNATQLMPGPSYVELADPEPPPRTWSYSRVLK